MKYIKIYESFVQMSTPVLAEIKSMIESGIESGIKTPIYLEASQETPGLVKFLSELLDEKSMDMMIINPDQLSLSELKDSFPKENPMDKGGIIFIEGMEEAKPENKKMVFDKILDGSIPPVWHIIAKGPANTQDNDSLANFTKVKLN